LGLSGPAIGRGGGGGGGIIIIMGGMSWALAAAAPPINKAAKLSPRSPKPHAVRFFDDELRLRFLSLR
jgi:hypothetical protein